jgi:hypothetical protein
MRPNPDHATEIEARFPSNPSPASWRLTGRVDVAPLRRAAGRGAAGPEAPRERRASSTQDPAHLDAVLTAAVSGPLSNEQIRELTGLDATGARGVATHLVKEVLLVTTGQRRGTRYVLP